MLKKLKFLNLRFLFKFALVLVFVALKSKCDAKTYTYKSYADIKSEIVKLSEDFPDYIELISAQEFYGLPSPGSCGTEGEQNVPCEHYVVTITKRSTLLEDPERPEVFFSGCLHGNERVGPTTLVESMRLLVFAAACIDGLQESACEYEEPHRSWMSFLVTTRVIVMMPMTNALGYYQNLREENNIDANRDFPYDQVPSECMKTVTARAVNEVWRDHIFQLALTFHGGMQAIAYEWGAPNHPGRMADTSPDDIAQNQLAAQLSSYSGKINGQSYPYDKLNDLVYPVNGGMEDWGYAASWDGHYTCSPDTYGGYPVEKTTYNNATLRAFNILVETADEKTPAPNTLGSDLELFYADGSGIGHISRNIRLVLMIADMVQPHVAWRNAPGLPDSKWSFQPVKKWYYEAFLLRNETDTLLLEWGVWGAIYVDTTQLYFGKWKPEYSELKLFSFGDIVTQSTEVNSSCKSSGDGRWKNAHMRDSTTFSCTVNTSTLPEEGEYFVMAGAIVDQAWKSQPNRVFPTLPPQSHVVNARTNKEWNMHSNGHAVKGRLEWYTPPIRLVLGTRPSAALFPDIADTGTISAPANIAVVTIPETDAKSQSASGNSTLPLWHLIVFPLIGSLGLLLLFVVVRVYRVSKKQKAAVSNTAYSVVAKADDDEVWSHADEKRSAIEDFI